MRKIFLFSIFIFLPATVFAASSYITFNLTGTYPQNSGTTISSSANQVGIGGTTSVGFATDGRNNQFRGEIEVGYRTNKITHPSERRKLWSFMSNGFVDFSFRESGKLTIGAGIGMADVRGSEVLGDNEFAYQGIIGWAIPVSEYDFLDIQYRYFGVSDIDSYGLHGIMVGFRMSL